MTATADLLDFVRARHVLPDAVRSDTIRLLADTLAVGAAGSTAPGAAGVLATARGWGSGEEARLLGSPERLPASSAAFVNGFRIHCLEWDAVHEPAVVHALSVVTAALSASIDRMDGCDPEEALVALAFGVDIAAGLGIAATSPLTFFRPATAGCIGAALAVARLEGVEPLEDVLGLAYSSCAGTMQAHVEGSIALPLQIANAARAAVCAVDLVKAGLTGPHDALEGPFGYFQLFNRGDLARYTAGLGKVWRISEVSTKPFPCGRASHAALGALQLLPPRGRWQREALTEGGCTGTVPLRRFAPPPQEGEEFQIEAQVPPLVHRLVGRPMHAAMTPAYARLCVPFLAALMLRDGIIDPRAFTPETFADPELAAIAARVSVAIDDNPDPNALSPQRLIVDGVAHDIADTLGSPAAPLSSEQASTKLALIRDLAPAADPRLFDDPLGYFASPIPFVPSEVEGRLGADEGVSTLRLRSGEPSLDTNGKGDPDA